MQLHAKIARLCELLRLSCYLLMLYKSLLRRYIISKEIFLSVKQYVVICVQYAQKIHVNIFKRKMPFSYKQYCSWAFGRICGNSLLTLCRNRHPQQLTVAEQNSIVQYANEKRFEDYSLSSIYCQLLRDEKLHCHISTFYKYCRLLNITHKHRRIKKVYTPLTASAPLQMLHMDVTLFRTADNIKQYLYVIRDNFSKAILACKASLQYSSTIACDTLKTVLEKFNLMNKEGILITDDGSENKGAVLQLLNKPGMLWKKLIAQIDIIQSNSMVEAANKIIKRRFLYKQPIADFEMLNKKLPDMIETYNNTPLITLSAYTPNEVLAGKIPDKKRFEKQFFIARKKRIATNQNFNCTDTC
jgi:hypothetical protein